MQSGLIAAALAVSALLQNASDWYHVDSAQDHANASFIDKASIHANAAGNLEAMMFSLLAREAEGDTAYRFTVEFDCAARKSRLVFAETFDADHQGSGMVKNETEWASNGEGTQGNTILAFVCSRGASLPDKKSLGSALPWDVGRGFF